MVILAILAIFRHGRQGSPKRGGKEDKRGDWLGNSTTEEDCEDDQTGETVEEFSRDGSGTFNIWTFNMWTFNIVDIQHRGHSTEWTFNIVDFQHSGLST